LDPRRHHRQLRAERDDLELPLLEKTDDAQVRFNRLIANDICRWRRIREHSAHNGRQPKETK
jgi:hypothetical protein